MVPSKHILIIAVGPVQTFIAAGRKLRDLAAGSRMLSDLAKEIAIFLESQGCDVIFPSLPSSAEARSELLVANKILVIAGTGDMGLLVEGARNRAAEFYKRRFNAVRDKYPIDATVFDAQTKDVGELYAAWIPFVKEYRKALEQTEELLSARKTLRNFSAPAWADAQNPKKSSLDGMRESVIPQNARAAMEREILLKPGEELDGIGLVKRLAKGLDRFDSLTSLALGPFLAGLENPANQRLKSAVTALKNSTQKHGAIRSMIPAGGFDFLHPGWLETARKDFEDRRWINRKFAEEVSQHLRDLEAEKDRAIPKIYGNKIGTYAAIIHGDGDHMGAALSKLANSEDHKVVSEALADFAFDVRRIIEEYEGCLIYSGGDDVLAFLPLHTLRTALGKLQKSFQAKMTGAFAGKTHDGATITPPTLSVGAAIVHHKAALSDSLDLAREAEGIAKNRFGRDALAITVSKRSGGEITVGGKWAEFSARLQGLVDHRTGGEISAKLAYDLRPLERKFGPYGIGNVTCWEAARILRRKLDKPAAAKMEALLSTSASLEAFCNELIVAQLLEREEFIARGEWNTFTLAGETSEAFS